MNQPNSKPISLAPEEQMEIAVKMATCPFVGAAVATGQLPVYSTKERPLAVIDEVAHIGDLGGGDLGTRVLRLFARGNHSRWIPFLDEGDIFVPNGTFSLQFGGSQGAHAGHSGILLGDPDKVDSGRFDQAQFDRLAEHADLAGRLSIDSIGDFIAENLKQDPNAQVLPIQKVASDIIQLLREFKDLLLAADESEKTETIEALTKLLGEDHLMASAGEWGLLFAFLKNGPNSHDGDIALTDVTAMFVDKRLPDGWETWEKSALSWINATLLLAKDAALAYHWGWT
jgi:hypothetical protein